MLGGLLGGGAVALAGCSDTSATSTGGTGSSGWPSATTSPALAWGPTKAQLDAATTLVSGWSDDQLAGQMLVLTYDGTAPATAAAAVTAVHAAGVIVMKNNVATADQVKATATAVQKAVSADRGDVTAVVAVDQEGGIVARLGDLIPATPAFMSAGAAIAGDGEADHSGADAVTAAAEATGNALRALGFTWVFAPDGDVTIGPDDPTIASRSPGGSPGLVGKAVTAAVTGYRESRIGCSVKHFPGHGSVTADSHLELPRQTASLEELRSRDLPPFTAATVAGVPVIMMSHLAVDAFEPGVPCTLSSAAYQMLRRETGFEGVVCTDAMNMQAITKQYGAGPAAAKAVIAGADVVLMPADAKAAHQALLAALGDGSLARDRLIEAAARVVALQAWLGEAGDPPPAQTAEQDLATASRALSAAAITLVSGTCSGALVTDAVRVSGGTDTDRALFTAAAQDAGLAVGSGPTVLLAPSGAGGSADIVVALETPYVLGSARGSTAEFALYGRTAGAFEALIEVLTGKASARGRLPVEVGGVEPPTC